MIEYSREYLEQLAANMSISEMAEHLKVPKSTLYYNLRKLGVVCRTRSDAQKIHIQKYGHQREGHPHSEAVRQQISESSSSYWKSKEGEKQKEKLAKMRRREWKNTGAKLKQNKISQLRDAPRPRAGTLSKFGVRLVNFLAERGHKVITAKNLTDDHVSDIILENEQVVIELIPPIGVFGQEAEEKLMRRYDRIVEVLNALQYKVLIVQQSSNSISRARCQRVYNELLSLKGKSRIITS